MRFSSTPLPVLLVALLSACAPSEPPTSAILITLDTTRADVLGCYNGPSGLTPRLDRLATESIVFDAARTVAPITLPAHASMLTGLYPPRHTLRDNARNALPSAAFTLAEAAQEAGYETAAFVSAVVLDRSYGLSQGFDVYRQPESNAGRDSFYVGELPSEEIAGRFEAWWKERDAQRPFLVWIHLFDPHAPYAPPRRFAGHPHPYLGEVAAMDEAIGRMLDRFDESGALDRSLLVVVADHGESLGHHDEPSHGVLCYEATIRVPFLIRPPASIATIAGVSPGGRSDAVVSVADVFPTVVEALGLSSGSDTIDGISLLQAPPRERGVYFETYGSYLDFGWAPLFGWADRSAKYVHGARPELYDIAIDPGEERDLAVTRADSLAAYLDHVVRATSATPLPADAGGGASEELLSGIRDLGYTGAGDALPELPGPLDETGLANPADKTDELLRYADSITLLETGKNEEAAELLRELVALSPGNFYALEALAKALFELNEYEECIGVIEGMLRLRPNHVQHTTNLGLCHERLGRTQAAEASYRRSHELAPEDPQPVAGLVRIFTKAGNAEQAQVFTQKLRALQGQ